jgi:Cd2+/Zn2+-exporting ATPase
MLSSKEISHDITHIRTHNSDQILRLRLQRQLLDNASLSEPPVAAGQAGATVLLIPAMDCPSEENDIRRALADIDGIRSLSFQLSARTLSIDAPDSVLPAAVEAIRQAGYEAKTLAAGSEASEGSSAKADLWKAVLALALATGAELVHFIAPDTLPFMGLGMAMAAIAIGLAGLSTYTKGLAALRRGQLNMNALMGVAVTGAFLIGSGPRRRWSWRCMPSPS